MTSKNEKIIIIVDQYLSVVRIEYSKEIVMIEVYDDKFKYEN